MESKFYCPTTLTFFNKKQLGFLVVQRLFLQLITKSTERFVETAMRMSKKFNSALVVRFYLFLLQSIIMKLSEMISNQICHRDDVKHGTRDKCQDSKIT